LIRYADDLVAFCHSRQQAEQIKAQLATWLRPRGLAFNEDKTRITHLDEGFDFLGFTIRRCRGTLLITPSATAVRRLRERLLTQMRSLRGTNAETVIARLNPIVRGCAAYYRNVVSSKVFTELDHYMWQLTYKWARCTHPNKPTRWIVRRYFGAFNTSRRDQWVFGDRDSGAYLLKFAWTRIVRHQMVTGTASPDDPVLADYWNTRRRKGIRLPIDGIRLRLLQAQRGHCARCGELLLHADHPPQTPDEWEQWLAATPKAIGHNAITMRDRASGQSELRLIHTRCRPRQPGTPSARHGLA
jgi:RNA-directed DNA polymerase